MDLDSQQPGLQNLISYSFAGRALVVVLLLVYLILMNTVASWVMALIVFFLLLQALKTGFKLWVGNRRGK